MENIRDLKNQIEELKVRLSESQETLQAIQSGEVDALVVHGPSGDQVYTIQGADTVYRTAIENINEGVITLSPEGVILYSNHYFAQMMRTDLNRVVGTSLFDFIGPESCDLVAAMLAQEKGHAEVSLHASDGTQVPTYLATTRLQLGNSAICAVVTDLTQQKRREDIIMAGNLVQSIMEQSPITIIIFDAAGIIIFASKVAHRLFGRNVLGQRIESILASLYSSGKAMRLADIQSGAITDDTIFYAEKNGKRTHLLLRYGRLEGDGGIKGSLISLTNITQLKLAEDSLRESEERFKVAVRNAAVVLAQYDLGLRYVWIYNPHPDFEPASVICKRDDELEDSEGARRLVAVKQRVIDSGVGTREEISFDRSDGIKVYEFILEPLTDSRGNIVGGTTSALDITERKKAEEEIRRQALMLNAVGDSVITSDMNGKVIYWNEAASRIYGWSRAEALGRNIVEVNVPRISQKQAAGIMAKLGRGVSWSGEFLVQRKDGTVFPAEVNDASVFDRQGKLIGIIGVSRDITERKKAEEALTKAKDELEIRVEERTRELALANEQLRQYSYRVTQIQEEERKRIAYELGEELAQTLAAIKLEADLMTAKVNSSLANVNSHVDSIREMMGTVVRHATNFSNELRPSVLGSLGLPDALGAIIKEMNRNGELGIILKTNGSQRRLPDEIETALFRIAQEATNNIIRHSGATKAKVNVGFLKTGIKLTIIDNGKGFDTELKPELTLKDGYGLIDMKERAHQIGGELKIKSELGKGTTITVTVPLQSN